jgi:hypothetical protein
MMYQPLISLIINRDFMPKDDEAYNELMTWVIINPVYPIESEKKYNAEIKSKSHSRMRSG